MKTRTRNAIALAGALAVMTIGLVWAARQRSEADLRSRALDSIPNGALLVGSADLDALRAAPSFAPLLKEGREIPGLGTVREVCGFDPMDALHEIAVAIPAAGDEGDFGVVAAGSIDDEALLACASKVIEARGGRPTVTQVGSFQTVRDATLAATGGEIAVRKGGPVLLGAGPYLRAMIDASDGRSPSIRSSVAHTHLAREIGRAALRLTVVLTPEQRRTLEAEILSHAGSSGSNAPPGAETSPPPGGSLMAGAVGVDINGPDLALHGLLLCDSERACASIATSLKAARDEQASDFATRLVGTGAALERIQIEAEGEQIHARLSLPQAEAIQLAERILALRGLRHPMPTDTAMPSSGPVEGPPGAAPSSTSDAGAGADAGSALAPDEIIKAAPNDGGAPAPKKAPATAPTAAPTTAPR